jgi:hypothetical protein
MLVQRLRDLMVLGRRAVAQRDPTALRRVIASLYGEVSPRLALIAIAAAQALDHGEVLRAMQLWACLTDVLGSGDVGCSQSGAKLV